MFGKKSILKVNPKCAHVFFMIFEQVQLSTTDMYLESFFAILGDVDTWKVNYTYAHIYKQSREQCTISNGFYNLDHCAIATVQSN